MVKSSKFIFNIHAVMLEPNFVNGTMALHKITVLGDTAVGKTALIIQLISDCFIESVREVR